MQNYTEENVPPAFLKQQLLFQIDSIPDRPQCHASNIMIAKANDKEILLYACWFAGIKEGYPGVGIMMTTISYEPKSDPTQIQFKYATPHLIASHDDRACGNPVLFLDSKKRLHLFYTTFIPHGMPNHSKDRQIRHKISQDEGKTWTQPVIISDRAGMWVRNPLLVLQDGTWLLPMNDEVTMIWKYWTNWSSRFAFSKDQGQTWQYSPLYSLSKGMIQPSVVQFKDGELYCINRSRTGWIAEMRSKDQGKTWSRPQNTSIPNNNSCACMTLLKNEQLVMVCNPIHRTRSPISVLELSDQGQN